MDDFLQNLKKVVHTCYTDRLLANKIEGIPVRISCHVINFSTDLKIILYLDETVKQL